MTDREELRKWMKDNGLTLKDVRDSTGIKYDRLVHILNGFRPAKPEEEEKLAAVMRETA